MWDSSREILVHQIQSEQPHLPAVVRHHTSYDERALKSVVIYYIMKLFIGRFMSGTIAQLNKQSAISLLPP